ncbi:hypothetical protein AB0J83_04655 [Actinoplanes sp. NPDC049596]|uniref:hypothetical protein n=1 Tax=unclassified Actinoplanes TaxID=2626549 RepID=UPI00342F77CA
MNRNAFAALRGLRRLLAVSGAIIALSAGASVPVQAAAGSDTLWGGSNEALAGAQNQGIFSASRRYEARMQSDGNFVVYGPNGPLWSSNTRGNNPRLVMQSDGNLVIYSDSGVIFTTNTQRRGGNRLVIQDDGNLVLYGSGAVWSSMGSGERAIQWFYNNNGRTNYEGKCELAVENAFGTSGRFATARANANARPLQQPYTDAPRGSLVFYNTSASGHVAISLGAGKVYSTSAGGRIGIVPISYFQNPLGWSYAPW